MRYPIRRIQFNGVVIPILLQTTNGPCPILAIINVLLIIGKIKLNDARDFMESEALINLLVSYLSDRLTMLTTKDSEEANMHESTNGEQDDEQKESFIANAFKNFSDSIQHLRNLEKGLDVNVIFSSIDKFEFTGEIGIFDCYGIRLFHGWVYDPQQYSLAIALGNMSYNEAINVLISENEGKPQEEQQQGEVNNINNDGDDDDEVKGEKKEKKKELTEEKNLKKDMTNTLIREFLDDGKGQLTVYGLGCIHETMKENELAVLFRNNHFSVIHKRNGNIYALVTDLGIVQSNRSVCWTTLADIFGDDMYLTDTFESVNSSGQQRRPNNNHNHNNRRINNHQKSESCIIL